MKKILSLILLCASMAIAITTGEVRKVSTPAEFEGYEYGAVTVRYNGMFYRFYCSHGLNSVPFAKSTNNYTKGWDYVRMRTSRDGATWSSPRVVVVPSSNVDSCACDPAIIRGDDGYWYLYYTGFEVGYSTETFVARSRNIYGPYDERYIGLNTSNKDAWNSFPKNPVPVLKTLKPVYKPDSSVAYGVGQASIVKKEGKYHFWFTDVYKAPSDSVNDVAKYWKFVHVVASNDSYKFFNKLQNIKRTPITFDGKKDTLFPMNDFGDVKWNPSIGKFEMWITNKHYMQAYTGKKIKQNVVYNGKTYHHIYKAEFYQYIKRYVSADGNAWYSTGDSLGPYHLVSNVGMSGDENGHIINGRYMVTFAASKDSLLFKMDSIPVVDTLVIWPGTVITMRETEGSAYGRPWSTYQFTVGSNVVKGETVLDQSQTAMYNGMRYYQIPPDLIPSYGKERKLEFIAGDFDGDGITDIGVVNRNTARWYIRSSLTGQWSVPKIGWDWQWPELTSLSDDFDIVLGDFDGDGITDRAIVQKSSRKWFVFSSKQPGQNALVVGRDTIYDWPFPGNGSMTHALSGDYDGDGVSDIGSVDCPVNASYCQWSYLSSKTGEIEKIYFNGSPRWINMDSRSNHIVLEGDFDGDGITDPTIWSPTYGWSVNSSRTGKKLKDPNLGVLDNSGAPVYLDEGKTIQKRGAFLNEYKWAGDYAPIVGDFNGDGISDMGKVDVNVHDDSRYYTWYTIVTPPISSSYFNHALKYFKLIPNYQILVGDLDGDGVSDCMMADRSNIRVYFYTSSYGKKPISRVISPLYNPSTGALYKMQFVPAPSVDEEKLQIAPVLTKSPKFNTQGLTLMISDMEIGSDVRVFNMIGQNIVKEKADFAEKKIQLPSKGMYIVRVGSQSSVINVK